MTFPQARTLARELVEAALGDDITSRNAGLATLESFDGRSWLVVDQAARWQTYAHEAPVSGVAGWLGTSLSEPSGFVAAVTSFHVDGRIRERAVQALSVLPGMVVLAALAVRLLDHVPQVRLNAWAALEPHLRVDTAEVVLDVLLAGRDRQHAAGALASVTNALNARVPSRELVTQLGASGRRRVRRWAYVRGNEQGVLSTEQLVSAARTDPDQWLRAVCAEWLMKAPNEHQLVALLDAPSVEGRLVALARAQDSDLSDL